MMIIGIHLNRKTGNDDNTIGIPVSGYSVSIHIFVVICSIHWWRRI